MNAQVINIQMDPVDAALEVGLKDLWFPVCPSGFIKESPISLRRLGYKIVLWRDASGKVHALEDHCPHRGAPLSPLNGWEPGVASGRDTPSGR